MSKVTIKQWTAPISKEDMPEAAKSVGKSSDDGFRVNILEMEPPVMQGTEANHPLVVSTDVVEGPVVLSPHPRPNASNYFHTNKLVWKALYADGSVQDQIGELGKETSTDDLSRVGLRKFALVTRNGGEVCSHVLETGDMFFYRRRTAMRPGHDVVEVIHIVGKTRSEDGPNDIIFFYESDMHNEIGDFRNQVDAIDEWRYPIKWHDSDLVPIS